MRRLPIYLLLDCSESMAGERIQTVENATRELHKELMGNPSTGGCAFISVITFNSEKIEVFPLKEVAEFEPPELKVAGTADLGAAQELVTARAMSEVEKPSDELRGDWSAGIGKPTEEQKGDWDPWVYIMSAFKPTDDLFKEVGSFQPHWWERAVCCAVDGADLDFLRQIAGVSVVDLNTEGASVTKEPFIDAYDAMIGAPMREQDNDDDAELPPVPDHIDFVE